MRHCPAEDTDSCESDDACASATKSWVDKEQIRANSELADALAARTVMEYQGEGKWLVGGSSGVGVTLPPRSA